MHRPPHKASAIVLSGTLGETPRLKGMNEAALAVTRSLGRHQIPVYRFHPDHSLIDLGSRYCVHTVCENCYVDEPGLADSLVAFARSQPEKPVLYPASDFTAEFIARYESRLSPYMALTSPSLATLEDIQNKGRLLDHASRVGMPIPTTRFPVDLPDAMRNANEMPYPAVVKPLTSHHWKTDAVVRVIGPVKAVVVNSAEEFLSLYRKLSPLAPEMMIQEIIQGDESRLLTFLGYIGEDGTPLGGCVRKKLRQYPLGFGYCCLTETVHDPEIMDLSLRLLKSLNYRGIVGVEFKRDVRDEKPKLIEINARAVRTTATAIAAGVDLPWIAYQDAVSAEKPTPVFEYTVPMRWIHMPSNVKAAWALMRRGELSFVSWLREFRGPKVFAIWAWDDLRPGLELLWVMGRKLVERSFQGIREMIVPRKPLQIDSP